MRCALRHTCHTTRSQSRQKPGPTLQPLPTPISGSRLSPGLRFLCWGGSPPPPALRERVYAAGEGLMAASDHAVVLEPGDIALAHPEPIAEHLAGVRAEERRRSDLW